VNALFVDSDVKPIPTSPSCWHSCAWNQANRITLRSCDHGGFDVRIPDSPLMLIAIIQRSISTSSFPGGGAVGQEFLTNYALINLHDRIAPRGQAYLSRGRCWGVVWGAFCDCASG